MGNRPWENWDAPGVIDWLDADWSTLGVDPVLSSLIDMVEIHHGSGPILDVGCGTGRVHHALWMRTVLRPHGYVGVDVTAAMVERAKKRYPGVDFRVADVHDLPFADGAFGSVVCVDVLQHLPAIEEPIAELCRVAREQVFLLLWLPNRWEPGPRELVHITIPDHGVNADFYENTWTDEEVLAACDAAGGEILDFQVIDDDRHDFGLLRVGVR